jgi:hypothetical protein
MRSQHCLATRMIEDGENTETVKDYKAVDTLLLVHDNVFWPRTLAKCLIHRAPNI